MRSKKPKDCASPAKTFFANQGNSVIGAMPKKLMMLTMKSSMRMWGFAYA